MPSNPYPHEPPRCQVVARDCIAPGVIRIDGLWLCVKDAVRARSTINTEPMCMRGLVQHDAAILLHDGTCYCPFTPQCEGDE